MRVTQKMIMRNHSNLLSKNLKGASKAMAQASSGKLYEKISDNPIDISRALSIRTKMGANEVYEKNIERAMSETDNAELAVLDINSSIQRIREVLSSAKSSGSVDTMEAAKVEVVQLAETLVDNLNVSFNGKHLFAGTLTKNKPFSIVSDGSGNPTIVNSGNDESMDVEIADGVHVSKNIKPSSLFSYDGGTNTLSTTINKIVSDLSNSDNSNLNTYMEELSQHETNVLTSLSKLGATSKRYEDMLETHANFNFNLQDRLSNLEDADVDKAYIEYTQYQMAYEVSISAIQKLGQLSLLKILR